MLTPWTSIDISPANIAFTCNNALETDEYLWEALGGDPTIAPYEGPEPRSPHLPAQVVASADWAAWFEHPVEDIRLIDWGESFPADETRSVVAQPVNMRSPETFFVESFDSRHDLWRAGCVVSLLPLLDYYIVVY